MVSPTASPLPYQGATSAQRTQALHYLQGHLAQHFPTLAASALRRALDEFRPDLWYMGDQVTLAPLELRQFVQHVAARAALPELDPLIYEPSRHLAQHVLYSSELAVWLLPELETGGQPCGPRPLALLRRLTQPPLVAHPGLALGRTRQTDTAARGTRGWAGHRQPRGTPAALALEQASRGYSPLETGY